MPLYIISSHMAVCSQPIERACRIAWFICCKTVVANDVGRLEDRHCPRKSAHLPTLFYLRNFWWHCLSWKVVRVSDRVRHRVQ